MSSAPIRVADSPLYDAYTTREQAQVYVCAGGAVLRRSSIRGHYAATYYDKRSGALPSILLREVPEGIAAVNEGNPTPVQIFRTFRELYTYLQLAPYEIPRPRAPVDEDPC